MIDDQAESAQLHLNSPSSQSYSDSNTLQWLKASIASCKKHQHSLPKARSIPDRLIEVDGNIPRLVVWKGKGASPRTRLAFKLRPPRYAALSYCWGTSKDAKFQLKTTSSSLPQRRAGLQHHEIESVPALQDAIYIARALSISHLWVDSLCIFQDDTSDWEQQCAQMDKIYSGAEVTLIAASSSSCRDGFLQQKGHRLLLPSGFLQQPGPNRALHLQFKFVDRALVRALSKLHCDTYYSPLWRRGWAVQERLLPTRQIIFGKSSIHFLCPEQFQSRGCSVYSETYFFNIDGVRGKAIPELYANWSGGCMSQFTEINKDSFTHPTDLLPAIAGIASVFSEHLQDDYCAGHWRKDLHIDLMWSVHNRFNIPKSEYLDRIQSPEPYIVPSWSRLCKGYTENLRSYQRIFQRLLPEVEYLDPIITLQGKNKFGSIRDAQLHVKSAAMTLEPSGVMRAVSVEPVTYNSAHLTTSWLLTCRRRDETLHCSMIALDYTVSDLEIHEDVGEWRWLLLGSCALRERYGAASNNASNTDGLEEEMRYPYGLLVHRIQGGSKWCRVGTFLPNRYGSPIPTMSLRTFREASKVEVTTII